jgi:hypothetical protein
MDIWTVTWMVFVPGTISYVVTPCSVIPSAACTGWGDVTVSEAAMTNGASNSDGRIRTLMVPSYAAVDARDFPAATTARPDSAYPTSTSDNRIRTRAPQVQLKLLE